MDTLASVPTLVGGFVEGISLSSMYLYPLLSSSMVSHSNVSLQIIRNHDFSVLHLCPELGPWHKVDQGLGNLDTVYDMVSIHNPCWLLLTERVTDYWRFYTQCLRNAFSTSIRSLLSEIHPPSATTIGMLYMLSIQSSNLTYFIQEHTGMAHTCFS